MSQRPHAPVPPNTPPNRPRNASQPSQNNRPQQEQDEQRIASAQEARFPDARTQPPRPALSGSRLPPVISSEPAPSRLSGVHSILNSPAAELDRPAVSSNPIQIRPSPVIPLVRPHSSTTSNPGTAHNSPILPPERGDLNPNRQATRRILTARSPSTRAASLSNLGRLSMPTAKLDVTDSPFLPTLPRTYFPEAGTPTHPYTPPGAPTPPMSARGGYGFPSIRAPTPPMQNRTPGGGMTGVHSQSASPSTTYSSYSQFSQASPVARFTQTAGHPPGPAPTAGPTPRGDSPPGLRHARSQQSAPPGPPQHGYDTGPPALAQQQYQYMTIQTENGPLHVPIDMQAASKAADEKRKRNAGASARFRQRRKMKEAQAGQTIGKLEQNLNDARDAADFYQAERDVYRDFLAQHPPLQAQLGPRPQSPGWSRRGSERSDSEDGTSVQGSWSEQGNPEERSTTGRSTRRRTSSYRAPIGLPPPNLSSTPSMPTPGFLPPPTMPPSLPEPRRPMGGPGAAAGVGPPPSPLPPFGMGQTRPGDGGPLPAPTSRPPHGDPFSHVAHAGEHGGARPPYDRRWNSER